MKKCLRCNDKKDLIEFVKCSRNADGHTSVCLECNRGLHRDKYHKQRDLDKVNERVRRTSKFKRRFTARFKSLKGCKDCGIKDYRVLEFDHLFDKSMNVSEMTSSYSLKRIKEEIRKCDVVCANCHRIRTHDEYFKYDKN